ncbi:hypothetical protein Py17XNL_001303490 [Plasmodium yoelii yoelii]|uniref:Uncharacterized protein n=1 Tax=Plasmodium yoelii yoelii TaxID=73239 RepID=A0AAE9WUI9_PLAYO|nr:hypothetical protein Py17XNL_001303490 [Plasmodium yoelii yoelii]
MVKNKRKGQQEDDVLSNNGENEYSEETKSMGNVKHEDSRNFEISDYLSNKDNSEDNRYLNIERNKKKTM